MVRKNGNKADLKKNNTNKNIRKHKDSNIVSNNDSRSKQFSELV